MPDARRQTTDVIPTPDISVVETDAKLDDVMLAMDVVDTLRHERQLINRELGTEVRRENLIDRLRQIYDGQGISVPDDILMDGVLALEEERFTYDPPEAGFIARTYINRRKWLPLIWTFGLVTGAVAAINYVGFVRPAQIEASETARVLAEAPAEIEAAYSQAIDIAEGADAITAAEALLTQGRTAVARGDAGGAAAAVENLEALNYTLALDYDIRAETQTGIMSAVDRTTPGRGLNYYLVVEGVDAAGNRVEVPIRSEETGETIASRYWGVRIDRGQFESYRKDFQDNGIIDAAEVGSKSRGYLEPDYVINTTGGTIPPTPDMIVR